MPITWKKKFKPDVILQKIDATRSVSTDGRASFTGLDHQEYVPVLASMLNFPTSADRINKSSLIWAGLSKAQGKLNQLSFEAAINKALRKELSTAVERYLLISSISLKGKNIPRSIKILDATIEFLPRGIPRSFDGRHNVVKKHSHIIEDTPATYLPVRISVRDKSPTAAAQQAIDYLDLFRGLMALYVNFAMQWTLGGSVSYEPINRVRCGSRHTIHSPSGKIATEAFWFEPNFRPAKIYEAENSLKLFEVIRRDVAKISKSPYTKELANALIKYARSLDEPDANTAFIKLWSALESVTTPGIADYDKMIKRCCFLYSDGEYHRQILEHLREYRNKSVHSGVEGEDARTNCYLLQSFFRTAVHFYKGNHQAFSSLDAANEFLDLPADRFALAAQLRALRKAMRFTEPYDT